jgi:AbrB family looped-hinge helix DNA binding protein
VIVTGLSEKVKVGLHSQIVIPKKLHKKHDIQEGTIIGISETEEGLLLKPFNSITEIKGLGKRVFKEPVKYQTTSRQEWDSPQRLKNSSSNL